MLNFLDKKIHRWIVVAGLFIYLSSSWGVIYNLTSLYMTPVQEHLGLSRQYVTMGLTFRSIGVVLGGLALGAVYKRLSVMKVLRASSLVLPAIFFTQYFINHISIYYLSLCLQTFFVILCGFVPVSILINQWFPTNRGFVMGITTTGSSVGGVIFNMLGSHVLINYGWQESVMAVSASMAVVMALTSFLLISENRDFEGDREEQLGSGLSYEQIKGDGTYYPVILIVCLMGASVNGTITNIIPRLLDSGYGIAYAAKMISLNMVALSFGKFFLGYLYDKLGIKKSTLISAGTLGIGVGAMYFSSIPIFVPILAIGIGVGTGFASVANPVFINSLYGEKEFSRISGYLQGANGLGAIIAPIIISLLYGVSDSYDEGILVLFFSAILVIILTLIFVPDVREEDKLFLKKMAEAKE